MKLSLKDFQEEAVALLRRHAARAAAESSDDAQALVLAAPTGSGKTVIATAWIEQMLEGDEEYPEDPDSTFLWITDQPELNEQTRRKMVSGSSVLGLERLVTVDASFDAETFDAGKVYFLNTQKLGRDKQLVTTGDKRAFSIWDTVSNTAAQRPKSFWVVVDEAHKGMSESRVAREEAVTIVQKFIKGSEGELPAVPLLLGISATPDRFNALLAGTERINRPVTIDPESVRSSGLLKEAITLFHPDETQPADVTLLRAAAEQLKRYQADWDDYTDKEQTTAVRPILVVQVEDASATKLTKTDVAACLQVASEVLGPLGEAEVAHAFQEGTPLLLGDERRVRYVAPVDIQEDPGLRMVLFKRALSTGWDCPRAEVMMSYRRAIDKTHIAQLVGRMVRTPLARGVASPEFLNSVSLYLPHYDTKALNEVIEYLTDPDPEIGFPTRVQRGESLVTLKRNPACAEAFAAAEQLITYRVERASKQSAIRRLLRLGRLLAWDKLDEDAGVRFTNELVDVLDAERAKVADEEEFKERLLEAALIDVRSVTVAYGETNPSDITTTKLAAVSQNVDHAFAEAGRKIGGGLHAAYLQERAAQEEALSVPAIKLELYALLEDPGVGKAVDERAAELLAEELEEHKVAVRELSDERRQKYRHIRRQAAKPEPEPWELPESIEGSKDGNVSLDRHLYINGNGKFACTLNEWEKSVMKDALADDDVVGWLRNDPRKSWSFALPYEHGGQFKPMFPDFMLFRRQGAGVVCDIVEPHSLSFEDSAAKAKGLASFARSHGAEFGRIQLIAKVVGALKVLSLDDIPTRDKVLGVSTNAHLNQVFEDA